MSEQETANIETNAAAPQSDGTFEEGVAYTQPADDGPLQVDLDGYEGPLDVLLVLARAQKVDLGQISILHLAEQYLVFVRDAQNLKIELAADYLVMASWLAYLKSRLLVPADAAEEDVSAEDMSARLVFQLQRLEAMREAVAKLMARDLLGRDVFAHGMPEGIRINRSSKYHASLYDLLASYSTQRIRNYYAEWSPPEINVLSVERARMRLERLLGKLDNWETLDGLLLSEMRDKSKRRTTLASSLNAALEFVRDGRLELQQARAFGPVQLRRARPKISPPDAPNQMPQGEDL